MDLSEFRSLILESGIDIWSWIDMSISLASVDHESELRKRRDEIVQKLYTPSFSGCKNCNQKQKQQVCSGEEEEEEEGELGKILEIKFLLNDENQNEGALIELLQKLVDMDTSFDALKETDIGRHVTRLRKHSCNEVRKLVKVLVRKWKQTVDEWVRSSTQTKQDSQFDAEEGDERSIHEPQNQRSVTPSKHVLSQNHHQIQHEAKKQRTASQALDFKSCTTTSNSMTHVKFC